MAKVLFLQLLLGAAGVLAASTAYAEPGAGVGSDGTIGRLCGNSNGKTIAETYGHCKRGDIIGLGRLEAAGVMMVCDFSKSILYVNGRAAACVFIGQIRSDANAMAL